MYTTIGALKASPGASGSGIFPSIIDVTFSQLSSPYRAALPGDPTNPGVGISAGQLLIILITSGSGADPNATPSGWVQLIPGDFHAFYRWAIGNEGGTRVNVSFPGPSTPGFTVIRVHGGLTTQNPQGTIFTSSAATTSIDPPSITTAWTASNTLFIIYGGTSDREALSSYPSDYTLGRSASTGAQIPDTSAFVASKQLASPVTENPGPFVISTTTPFHRTVTIAVRGT